MDKIYKKYQGHTIENWISETSPDFKKFAGYVKRRMKIAAADRGIVLEDFIVGHYFISGFFRKMRNGRIFHLMNVEIARLILQQRIAGKVFC